MGLFSLNNQEITQGKGSFREKGVILLVDNDQISCLKDFRKVSDG